MHFNSRNPSYIGGEIGGEVAVPCNRKSAIRRAEARGRRSELRVDLVLGVEVLSCWVDGGGATVVRPGRTTLASRTPQGRKSARVGRTYGAGSKRDGAWGQQSARGEGVNFGRARRRCKFSKISKNMLSDLNHQTMK